MGRIATRLSLSTRAVAVAAALLMAGGCARCNLARCNLRGHGFGNEEGKWAQEMRPPADEKQFSGLDARAQEIERNLGVR